jgi:hypothetical protein
MHSGILGPKNASIKKTKQKTNEEYSHKRKEPSSGFSEYSVYSQSEYHENGMLDDDASTRSSTGSGISFSESCAQYTPTTVSTSGEISYYSLEIFSLIQSWLLFFALSVFPYDLMQNAGHLGVSMCLQKDAVQCIIIDFP